MVKFLEGLISSFVMVIVEIARLITYILFLVRYRFTVTL